MELSVRCAIWKLLILGIVLCWCGTAVSGRGLRTMRSSWLHYHFFYNETLARILVEYASAVYINDVDALISWTCSRCNGLNEGFRIVKLIVDELHCLQAFVGIAEDLGAIVIAFRGTQENSIQDWMYDLCFKQLDVNYPGIMGARVHQGFFYAYYNTGFGEHVVEAVKSILQARGGLSTMVTGHSMGGAMAALCALDLTANHDIKDVQVVTFGQPRIGNMVFAAYYNALVPRTYRMTHGHDVVPHLPPYFPLLPEWSYHHFAREIWIYKLVLGSLNYEVEWVCDSSGEDPTCSRSVSGNSIADHLHYFDVDLHAETAASCAFVLGKNV